MSRICPNDGRALQAFEYMGVTLDECSHCGGVWFDDGEIRRIQESGSAGLSKLEELVLPSVVDAPDPEDPRLCPNCRVRMRPYRYLYDSPILLDECGKCMGVWVDDGELENMAAFLQDEENEEDGVSRNSAFRAQRARHFVRSLAARRLVQAGQ